MDTLIELKLPTEGRKQNDYNNWKDNLLEITEKAPLHGLGRVSIQLD